MIELFLRLLLAHLIGDFVLQPQQWVYHKSNQSYKSKYLYYHALVHLFLTSIVLLFNNLILILIIAISHLIIDIIKIEIVKRKINSKGLLFFIDQLLHIMILISVCIYVYPEDFNNMIKVIPYNKLLLIIVCTIFITQVSSIIIKELLSYWKIENDNNSSLKNAGKYIGWLERLLVFGFVITNQITAIGFLITAKSVFRFGDLSNSKDRKLTEYILIGTLLSITIAILTGLFYLYLIKFM